jgi:ParB family chromosome partitioning protein
MQIPTELPIESIQVGQAIRDIDIEFVAELAKSINANGLLQPILVRPIEQAFEVVFGHHRLEACKQLGWKNISAFVETMSYDESFVTKIVENLQRNVEVNPLIEADGYVALIDHGWTIDAIASRIGKSDSYVSDRVGLIRRLHPAVASGLRQNGYRHLKPSHAELLARLESRHLQLELSQLVEGNRMSVRELEKIVSGGHPFRENVRTDGGSLVIALPREIVKCMQIKPGDPVYVYLQSRKRVAIEPVVTTPAEFPVDKRTLVSA